MTKPVDTAVWLQLIRDGRTNAEIAAHFECTVRTLDRRRAADPALRAEILQLREEQSEAAVPEHGTHQRYRRGCRCGLCRAANTRRCYAARLRYRERRGLPLPDPDRGRRRANAQVTRDGVIHKPDLRTRAAQAIARGEPTSMIMLDLGCSYEFVAKVRETLALEAAS